ncbi:MAG TPA: hypothetical protein VJ574_07620, partial [Candidatus Bathyarchaeia archaeon]|nr:hypothetical protein [Candidatus Bathyarchaeia archaeon]
RASDMGAGGVSAHMTKPAIRMIIAMDTISTALVRLRLSQFPLFAGYSPIIIRLLGQLTKLESLSKRSLST